MYCHVQIMPEVLVFELDLVPWLVVTGYTEKLVVQFSLVWVTKASSLAAQPIGIPKQISIADLAKGQTLHEQ